MRSCLPGAPVLVDRSDENAVALAGSLHTVGSQLAATHSHNGAAGTVPARTPTR